MNQEQIQKTIQDAVTLLHSGNHTCVALREDLSYTSELRGVAPILTKLEVDKNFFEGAVIADKVIGKSAAMLLILCKVAAIHADVISEHAILVLDEYRIPYYYEERVPYIVNRAGDGMCPMEKSVLEEKDPQQAYQILLETRQKLMQNS